MKVNFETIGNATLIVSENERTLLCTDPWFDKDPAYFGSWSLSHKFPEQQRSKCENSKFIFISHFHPDHLNLASLRHCKKSTIILAQHFGSRVENELRRVGFDVISLPSRKWINIGEKTKIMIFNNELQDSALLVELTDNRGQKSLILNLNDTGGYGFEKEIASISKKYKNSFYLQLHCWGDADMINLFDKYWERIPPAAARKFPVGRDIKSGMKRFNCNVAIPFSCHHQYQRRDSVWANKFVTPVELMSQGFTQDKQHTLLPAFQNIELKDNKFLASDLNPEKVIIESPIHESNFGDNWNSLLTKKQINECRDYFCEISSLFKNFKSIILDVGGVQNEMLKYGKGKATIKFKVPRSSLMKSIRREIFDDLLIGNFMKTQIINGDDLYNPDFTLSVAKYSDNGKVKAEEELKKYFNYYNTHRKIKDNLFLKIMKLRKFTLSKINKDLIFRLKNLVRK